MKNQLVFDKKRGDIGIRRTARKEEAKEHGCNYVVDMLDPVTFEKTVTVAGIQPDSDWKTLPRTDPRVQFVKLFDIIEGGDADWDYEIQGGGEDPTVEYSNITNKHEVFVWIRKIFQS